MRTRTFIGLALLICLLVIAGSPSLLQAIATGAHIGFEEAGVVSDPGAPARDTKATKGPAKSTLMLRGYSVTGNDLVDTQPVGKRTLRGDRLAAGASRRSLVGGAVSDHHRSLPLPPKTKGQVLDANRCPVVERGDDAMLANVADDASRRTLAAGADDPAACEATMLAVSKAASKSGTSPDAIDRAFSTGDRGGPLMAYVTFETQTEMIGLLAPALAQQMRDFLAVGIANGGDFSSVMASDDADVASSAPSSAAGGTKGKGKAGGTTANAKSASAAPAG